MAKTRIKTAAEIEAMRESGRMLASVLDLIEKQIEAGMAGIDINELCKREIKGFGAVAPFLGYQGFPALICVSVNDEVEHGIPNGTPFVEGDIVSVDFGVQWKGMITDSGRTLGIGTLKPQVQKLLTDTKKALMIGIDQVKDGVRVGDIGAAIEDSLRAGGYGVVEDLVGHGVGHELHEDPSIPNYGIAGTGPALKAGMTVAIEPMATLGGHEIYFDKSDGWTVRTLDGSLAAHFEHTILITDSGSEILTLT